MQRRDVPRLPDEESWNYRIRRQEVRYAILARDAMRQPVRKRGTPRLYNQGRVPLLPCGNVLGAIQYYPPLESQYYCKPSFSLLKFQYQPTETPVSIVLVLKGYYTSDTWGYICHASLWLFVELILIYMCARAVYLSSWSKSWEVFSGISPGVSIQLVLPMNLT